MWFECYDGHFKPVLDCGKARPCAATAPIGLKMEKRALIANGHFLCSGGPVPELRLLMGNSFLRIRGARTVGNSVRVLALLKEHRPELY